MMRVKVHALRFLKKTLVSVQVALPYFLFLHTHHSFSGVVYAPSPGNPAWDSEGSIPELPQHRGASFLHHHPRTI